MENKYEKTTHITCDQGSANGNGRGAAAHLLSWAEPETLVHRMPARMWAKGALVRCRWGCKMLLRLWKTFCFVFFNKTEHTHTYSATSLHDIYPKELKAYDYMEIVTWMLIAALFIVVKSSKQQGCPSVGGWINHGTSHNDTLFNTKKK